MSSSDHTSPGNRDRDESVWRRPPAGEEPPPPAPLTPGGDAATPVPYEGPPRAAPPPPDWSPPHLVAVPPPRQLPPQDKAAIDVEEQRARTVTYGIGIVAGAVMLVVLCAVCGRLIA